MSSYAHPEKLVETAWVAEHLKDPKIRLVEVDVDTSAYEQGHVPGAIAWNWTSQLCDTVRRDLISKADLERLMQASGIANDTTVILYGDNNNWFAAWALWQLEIYGHADVRLMNGGRKKWIAENRPTTTEAADYPPTRYAASEPDWSLRVLLPEVLATLGARRHGMVDVRSPDEFTGKILAPAGLAETCQRGGHIPGASNIPWIQACNDDGTFKSVDELKRLYEAQGITADKPIITYCRIGERSSHSWFALRHLLGYPEVRNYDGSWTEWGNLVGAPIEKGPQGETRA